MALLRKDRCAAKHVSLAASTDEPMLVPNKGGGNPGVMDLVCACVPATSCLGHVL